MTDLISRADAIEAKPEYRNEDMLDKEKSTYNKGWNDCNDAWVAIIKALPSAEAVSREMYDDVVQTIIKREKQFTNMVSVVRCKDCRHRDLFSCPLADNDFQKDEDFCSWGERQCNYFGERREP